MSDVTGNHSAAPVTQVSKPVQLQTKQSGAWRTAVRWDAVDESRNDAVLDAADSLLRAVGNVGARVVTDDGLQTWLMSWSATVGWQPWAAK